MSAPSDTTPPAPERRPWFARVGEDGWATVAGLTLPALVLLGGRHLRAG